jgi:hypothetical protein
MIISYLYLYVNIKDDLPDTFQKAKNLKIPVLMTLVFCILAVIKVARGEYLYYTKPIKS